MPLDLVFVLVRPARAANLGAACRALKNMDCRELRLVAPAPDRLAPETRAAAYGAWDVLDGAAVGTSLAEALADVHWVVGTSGKVAEATLTPRAFAEAWARRPERRTAVVFGPEASGLDGRELALCHDALRIPTAPEHSSLNLAQAVLVVAYEASLARQAVAPTARAAERASDAATAGELEATLGHLREALLEVGFLDPQNPDARLTELRRLLARAEPTPRELTLLRGLARQVDWAGRVAQGRRRGR
jgi:TrmH family RNA methyltransferase